MYEKQNYTLSDSARRRHSALDAEIRSKSKVENITIRRAAQKKKARLNLLRIYRRNEKPGTKGHKQCQTLTRDMRYLDKKHLKTGVTRDICSKKSRF